MNEQEKTSMPDRVRDHVQKLSGILSERLKPFVNMGITTQLLEQVRQAVNSVISEFDASTAALRALVFRYYVDISSVDGSRLNLNIVFPRYRHDCVKCRFVGCYNEYDLYCCADGESLTALARYGDAPHACVISGFPEGESLIYLVEARRRGIAAGFVKEAKDGLHE